MTIADNWEESAKMADAILDQWAEAQAKEKHPSSERARLSDEELAALFRLRMLGEPTLGIPADPDWIRALPYVIAGPSGESGPELLARYERITGSGVP